MNRTEIIGLAGWMIIWLGVYAAYRVTEEAMEAFMGKAGW